jgi:hypothetical protein
MSNKKGGSQVLATVSDYQKVFNSVEGRRVLRHLMKVHGFMQTSYNDNPYATAFNEGARNVIIQVMNKVRLDLNKLEEDIKEQHLQGDSDVII